MALDDRQRAEREYRNRQEQEYREQQEHERLEAEELERLDRLREEEYIRDYYENREQREGESLQVREYYAEYADQSGDDPLTMEGYERWVHDQWQIGRTRAVQDERARGARSSALPVTRGRPCHHQTIPPWVSCEIDAGSP